MDRDINHVATVLLRGRPELALKRGLLFELGTR
jgi:hypothetical protein